MASRMLTAILMRDADDDSQDRDGAHELLELLKDPFSGQLQAASVISALGISLGVTATIALLFSLLRPYHQALYAPKLKHADEKHAPPPLGSKPWSWILPVLQTNEEGLLPQIGMDATIFLRFVRMCRDMFFILAIIGIGILVPVHLKTQTKFANSQSKDDENNYWILRITPLNVNNQAIWAQVVVAYLFNFIVIGFLWWNYRKVTQLRRNYFNSEEYQHSLHSRTLMLYDIPREGCSDEGIARIIDSVVPNSSFARTTVARNVKDLPELIREHDHAVRALEKVLAKYLKNPQQLPPNRPTCKPSKRDRNFDTYPQGGKVDAIEYYTRRIRELEVEIKEVRASVDKRGSMPYGFASYSDIAEAHSIAYSSRNKHPHGATITLAPRPLDIIWDNMPLSSATRRRRRWVNNFWITILTLLWIAPNAMIAIFLVNLSNLGKVWKGFQKTLQADTTLWGVVQGIAAPGLTSLIYLALPAIFRRLSAKGGDQTKTSRDRHVVAKLFSFFVFNNLIVFSVFSALWTFVAGVVQKTGHGQDAWHAIYDQDIARGLFTTFCNNSPFWVTYLLQRQLGAAADFAQLWSLIENFFAKKFSSPTPRRLIELTAPPPFDYTSSYNYFLFYATVTLCFAGIQPVVLAATALYFGIDFYLKKYVILYRFVTKTESGGLFWRVLFNRLIFGVVLADLVTLLTTWVQGDGQHVQFFSIVPLPIIMIGFKIYCRNVFDSKIRYFSLRKVGKNPEAALKDAQLRSERLASKFGHPALYKKLITPMVHQKAANMLPSIYSGRLTDGREAETDDLMSVSGYSDMYALDAMQGGKTGKKANAVPGFEFVSESHMDFEYYKNRSEFAEQHGGGEIYGRDLTRPSTPGSYLDDFGSRPGTPMNRAPTFGTSYHQQMPSNMSGTSYTNYRPQQNAGYAPQEHGVSHARYNSRGEYPERSGSPFYAQDNSSGSALVRNAAHIPMEGRMSPAPVRRMSPGPGRAFSPGPGRSKSPGRLSPGEYSGPNTPGATIGDLGGGPQGYNGLRQHDDDPTTDPAQYDYFRGANRPHRQPGQGW